MAELDPEQLVIGANGHVWAAPLDTDPPEDSTEAMPAGWYDLGLITDDGVTFTDGKERKKFGAWQLFNPARISVVSRSTTASMDLEQWNGDNFALSFGGATITEPTSGNFKVVPPAPEDLDENMLCIEWGDNGFTYRVVMERGFIAEDASIKLVRAELAVLPVSFEVLGVAGEDPWYMLTDNPDFEPTS